MNITDRTINPLRTLTDHFEQIETATLPYTINYAAMLNGDTISDSTWTANGNLAITDSSTDTAATATVSGSPGCYTLTNTITTAAGIVDSRSIRLTIRRSDQPESVGDYA